MSKHTPGPWYLENGNNVFGRRGRLVASVGGYQNSADPLGAAEENAANAKLIVVAPALLKACENLLEHLDFWHPDAGHENNVDVIAARAIIAKAKS